MRKTLALVTFAVLLVCAAAISQAGENQIRMPGGVAVTVLDPGTGGVSFPRAIKSSLTIPDFPEAAETDGGKLMLAVLVRSDGSVGDAMVLDATHRDIGLEDAALDAVQDWQFRPARKKKAAVDSYLFYEFKFREDRRTRATPVWPEMGPVRTGLSYGGISNGLTAGLGDAYSGPGGISAKTTMATGVDAGSGKNVPTIGGSAFQGMIRTAFQYWIIYPGGLIDKRPRTSDPSEMPETQLPH